MSVISNSSDALFGPAYTGTSRSFDFTLLFEDTILTIVPSTLFLAAAIARAAWLINSPNKVVTSLSRSAKLVSEMYVPARTMLTFAGATLRFCYEPTDSPAYPCD
jgi:hypothetical protein